MFRYLLVILGSDDEIQASATGEPMDEDGVDFGLRLVVYDLGDTYSKAPQELGAIHMQLASELPEISTNQVWDVADTT